MESIKDRPKIDLTDPYKIAIIRGGILEGIRIAIFSLVDRSLLEYKNGKIKTPENLSSTIATRPVERKILDHLRHETSIAEAKNN
ncbi:MAG: hypothetical protein NT027_18960 [Proteobacteria bacterium]|nr:hypothetical protein [Pseudomonadota bacterium]